MYQVDIRKKVKHFILTGKIEEAKSLIEEHFPGLWLNNKIVPCSLESIIFISKFNDNDIEGAISMLQRAPLNCNQFQNVLYGEPEQKSQIVTMDKEGALIFIPP